MGIEQFVAQVLTYFSIDRLDKVCVIARQKAQNNDYVLNLLSTKPDTSKLKKNTISLYKKMQNTLLL